MEIKIKGITYISAEDVADILGIQNHQIYTIKDFPMGFKIPNRVFWEKDKILKYKQRLAPKN